MTSKNHSDTPRRFLVENVQELELLKGGELKFLLLTVSEEPFRLNRGGLGHSSIAVPKNQNS